MLVGNLLPTYSLLTPDLLITTYSLPTHHYLLPTYQSLPTPYLLPTYSLLLTTNSLLDLLANMLASKFRT